jgi:hypothetical protein
VSKKLRTIEGKALEVAVVVASFWPMLLLEQGLGDRVEAWAFFSPLAQLRIGFGDVDLGVRWDRSTRGALTC